MARINPYYLLPGVPLGQILYYGYEMLNITDIILKIREVRYEVYLRLLLSLG